MTARRLESIENQMRGIVTLELDGGKRLQVDEKAYRDLGMAGVLKYAGYDYVAGTRQPVRQGGKTIGTVPGDFDPTFIRSTSPWYQPRSGDFVFKGGHWEAAKNLGPGDLDAVLGFVRGKA